LFEKKKQMVWKKKVVKKLCLCHAKFFFLRGTTFDFFFRFVRDVQKKSLCQSFFCCVGVLVFGTLPRNPNPKYIFYNPKSLTLVYKISLSLVWKKKHNNDTRFGIANFFILGYIHARKKKIITVSATFYFFFFLLAQKKKQDKDLVMIIFFLVRKKKIIIFIMEIFSFVLSKKKKGGCEKKKW
jgi:hypothetical protein